MLTETILLAQNKQLRERIDELEETVRQYAERERQSGTGAVLPEGLPYLTRLEEKALLALLNARGVLSTHDFYRALYGDETKVELHIVNVMVCHLRKKLGDLMPIKTFWGRGYAIEREGLDTAETKAVASGEVRQLISEELAA